MQKISDKNSIRSKSRSSEMKIDASRIIEIELQELFTTFRTQFSLVVQAVAANVAFVGYSLTVDKPEIILIGAIFPLALLVVISRGTGFMIPILLSALELEEDTLRKNRGAQLFIVYAR